MPTAMSFTCPMSWRPSSDQVAPPSGLSFTPLGESGNPIPEYSRSGSYRSWARAALGTLPSRSVRLDTGLQVVPSLSVRQNAGNS
jgi:hypothetical protein